MEILTDFFNSFGAENADLVHTSATTALTVGLLRGLGVRWFWNRLGAGAGYIIRLPFRVVSWTVAGAVEQFRNGSAKRRTKTEAEKLTLSKVNAIDARFFNSRNELRRGKTLADVYGYLEPHSTEWLRDLKRLADNSCKVLARSTERVLEERERDQRAADRTNRARVIGGDGATLASANDCEELRALVERLENGGA